MAAYDFKHCLFTVCQIPASFLSSIVTVLTSSAADYDKCSLAAGSSARYKFIAKRHFDLTPRLLCPAISQIKRMIF